MRFIPCAIDSWNDADTHHTAKRALLSSIHVVELGRFFLEEISRTCGSLVMNDPHMWRSLLRLLESEVERWVGVRALQGVVRWVVLLEHDVERDWGAGNPTLGDLRLELSQRCATAERTTLMNLERGDLCRGNSGKCSEAQHARLCNVTRVFELQCRCNGPDERAQETHLEIARHRVPVQTNIPPRRFH
jgi:hypothetical protein